jgi:hypothetical protein
MKLLFHEAHIRPGPIVADLRTDLRFTILKNVLTRTFADLAFADLGL